VAGAGVDAGRDQAVGLQAGEIALPAPFRQLPASGCGGAKGEGRHERSHEEGAEVPGQGAEEFRESLQVVGDGEPGTAQEQGEPDQHADDDGGGGGDLHRLRSTSVF